MREGVLAASYGRCAYCGCDLGPHDPFAVDHVAPLARGGADRLDNLVAACHDCNNRKHDRTLVEWLIGSGPCGDPLPVVVDDDPLPEALWTVREVAAHWRVSTRSVYRWVDDGLPAENVGSTARPDYRIAPAAVRVYLALRGRAAPPGDDDAPGG